MTATPGFPWLRRPIQKSIERKSSLQSGTRVPALGSCWRRAPELALTSEGRPEVRNQGAGTEEGAGDQGCLGTAARVVLTCVPELAVPQHREDDQEVAHNVHRGGDDEHHG